MNPTRYPWIDHLKALGILLVVAGHATLPQHQHNWIYAFHMPLFFMVSGFLIAPGGFSVPARDFFRRRIGKLLIYFLAFGLLGIADYCYVFRHEQALPEALRGRIVSLLYASASMNRAEDLYPEVLWFFPGLITGLLITFAVWKIRPGWARAAGMLAVFATGFLLSGKALPWELESGCIAAGFLAAGHCVRGAGWDGYLLRARRALLPAAVAALLLGSYLALLNRDCLDIRAANIGNPLLALPAVMLLIPAFALLAMWLPASRTSTAVAAATILIFPVHTMTFPYVDRAARKLLWLRDGAAGNTPWYLWGRSVLVVAALTLAHYCYVRVKSRRTEQRAAR